jgi:hypothetical protein
MMDDERRMTPKEHLELKARNLERAMAYSGKPRPSLEESLEEEIANLERLLEEM